MVFGVIGFGLIFIVLLIMFVKYFIKDWFGYFMFGLVFFEVCMFILMKGKRVELERFLIRIEKIILNRLFLFVLFGKFGLLKGLNLFLKR